MGLAADDLYDFEGQPNPSQGGFIIARGFITAVGRLGVLLLRWFGAAQEHAAFKFQLAPLKFAGAARRQGGV